MMDELANLLEDFPGRANQTRCFTHVLNLVVKSIIKQFDLPKAWTLDEAADELWNLAGDIELEEELLAADGEEGEEGEDDNTEGWIDEREEMTAAELEALDACVHPIKLLLTKVGICILIKNWKLTKDSDSLRKTAYAVKNSTTILLPRWFGILEELLLNLHMIP